MNSIQSIINSIDPGTIISAFPVLPIAIGLAGVWLIASRMREIWR